MPLLLLLLGLGLGLGLVVLDRRLDRVLRKHGAVELDRGKLEVLGNVRVLDGEALLDGLPLDPLGGNRAGGDGRATAKSFELALDDAALVVDLDLKLHDVAASRRADEASADGALVLVERAHVARVLVVVEERLSVFRVGSNKLECRGPRRAGRAGRARASRHSREHLAAACRLPVCLPAFPLAAVVSLPALRLVRRSRRFGSGLLFSLCFEDLRERDSAPRAQPPPASRRGPQVARGCQRTTLKAGRRVAWPAAAKRSAACGWQQAAAGSDCGRQRPAAGRGNVGERVRCCCRVGTPKMDSFGRSLEGPEQRPVLVDTRLKCNSEAASSRTMHTGVRMPMSLCKRSHGFH
mmetsp:Transcript_24622/g.69509  ORF Transcript_24622/g.69509 Transcript_24622/m.69509 type:complete len:351 (+) Transcript_24622:1539-2591(+)